MSLTTTNKRNSHSRTTVGKNQNGLVNAEGSEGAWVSNGPLLTHDSSRTVDVTAAAHQLTAAEFVGGYVIISAGTNNVILPPASELFEYMTPGMAQMPAAVIGTSPAFFPSFKFVLRNDTDADVNVVDSLVGAKDAAAAPPASPETYLEIWLNGTQLVIPCYLP